MKFIRSHGTIILIGIMSILCLFAMGEAIHLTFTMYKMKGQVIKSMPANQQQTSKGQDKSILISKLKDQTLYFNGTNIEGVYAYLNGKEDFFVPVDTILGQSGIEYKVYSSDDIVEWGLKGQEFTVKIGESSLWAGKNRVDLGMSPITGKNHILVPIDLFTHLDGYTLSKRSDTVFLNYFPDYSEKLGKLKAIRRMNGKTVLEGLVTYSPDKKKLIYSIKGEGYYFAYSDGTRKRYLGEAKEAKWIDNQKIWMKIKDESFIVTKEGKIFTKVNNDWRWLGQTPSGEVFFSAENVLYYEKDGMEKEIRKLPWSCDRINAQSSQGPFVAVSLEEKGIYLLDKSKMKRIGEYNAAAMGNNGDEVPLNLSYAPDGKNFAFNQIENGLLNVNFMNGKEFSHKKITLNFPIENQGDLENISMKWVANDILLVYSQNKWNAVDIKGEVKVFERDEKENGQLYHMFK